MSDGFDLIKGLADATERLSDLPILDKQMIEQLNNVEVIIKDLQKMIS